MQSNQSVNRSAKISMVYLPRVIVIAVLLLVSVVIVKALIATKSQSDMNEPEVSAILIQTIESIHRPSNRIWSGYGTARTMSSADVVAEVGGRVIDRPRSIEAGSRVEKGDLIVRLDDSDYINALDAARQAVKSLVAQIGGLTIETEQMGNQVRYAGEEIAAAQRDLDRMDKAIAAGVGSAGERDVKLASMLRSQRAKSVLQQQLDLIPSRRARLEAELSSQRANERIAKENVERSMIRAPFAGELQSINTRVGDWVGVGSSVARVVDLARLEIPLKVAASASSWIKLGDEVRLWVRQPGGEPDQIGTVTRIAPEADSASRTMTIFVELEQDSNDVDRLLPGQFVHGRVVTQDPHERVILPRRAVQSNHVFVASLNDDGTRFIEIVPVKVAYSFESSMLDIDPLETQWVALEIGYEPVENSHIAVSLLDQIMAGMRVRVGQPDREEESP
ncbi:MAG: HlyD family efflux transporter periplasmic adaptor subunit [Phycisphaerales bacterium]|nr:HlyD family efflux transporter periplasmic adaptor subunit [Phycisphaerales bacterium]